VRQLGTISFSAPRNCGFKFAVAGKNGSSAGYILAFDYIEIVPQRVNIASHTRALALGVRVKKDIFVLTPREGAAFV